MRTHNGVLELYLLPVAMKPTHGTFNSNYKFCQSCNCCFKVLIALHGSPNHSVYLRSLPLGCVCKAYAARTNYFQLDCPKTKSL